MIINDAGRIAPLSFFVHNFKFNHHSSGRINKLITHPTPPPQQPSHILFYYRIMPLLNKRKKSIREATKEREAAHDQEDAGGTWMESQYSMLHFLAVKLSLHSTMHPTIALMQLMHSELRT